MIFDEMLSVTHFITQIKISPKLKDDIHIPELERSKGLEISEKISMSSLGLVWQVLFKGYEELQNGFHVFQHGEMVIIRLIYIFEGPSPDDLLKILSENKESSLKTLSPEILSKSELNHQEINRSEKIINNQKDISNKKTNLSIKSYRNFVDLFYYKKEGMLHTYLYNNVKLISFKEGEVIINVKKIADPNFIRTIAKLISTWTGRIWQITNSTSNIGKTLYEEDLVIQQKEIEIMKNDSEVKKILENFKEVNIHSITNINQTVEEIESNYETKKMEEK